MLSPHMGEITVHRVVEHEIPAYLPMDMFDEAIPEAIEPYMVRRQRARTPSGTSPSRTTDYR